MFPIPLMTSGTDRHLNSPSLQSKCPLPPFVVHKSLEFSLKETACTIQAVKEALEAGRLEDAVTYLESLKTKLVPLGKVADSQIRAHGRKPKEQPATSLVTDVVATRAFPESCVPPIPVPTISVDPSLVSESRRVMRHLTAAISSVGVSSSEDGLQGAPPTTASAFDSQVVKPRRPRLLWTPEDDELLAKGLKEFGTAYRKIATAYFPHRTGDQLRVRHKIICKQVQRAAAASAAPSSTTLPEHAPSDVSPAPNAANSPALTDHPQSYDV